MKLQIRRNIFETNSSSVHAMTICTEKEWEQFKKGELFYDDWNLKLTDDSFNYDTDENNMTYKEYLEYASEWEDIFEHRFTTPSGDQMVAFGYYGHD